jgi:hypothetical protein
VDIPNRKIDNKNIVSIEVLRGTNIVLKNEDK